MADSSLFKKIRPGRLRSQLILGIASILVILMSFLVIGLMNRQKKFFLNLNHDRAFALSASLANTANSYVISYELAGLQKLVSTYKDIPGIRYAIVTSDDGIVLGHTDEKYRGQKAVDSISAKLKPVNTIQTLVENNSILDIASPIIDHDKIVGWARVGLSQEYIQPNLKAIRNDGLLFILISLIVGSIFAIIVARRLSNGLQKLVIASQKIKAGDRNLRVKPSRSREVTELGIAFNQMLDEISSNEKLLSMVLENMPVGIWILDEKGNIVSTNPAGEKMWHGVKYVGVDEYGLYKAWFTNTGKEVQAHEWGAAIVLSEGTPVLDQEMEIECFDKSHKIILNSAIPLRDANEKIIGVITINVDITERRQAGEKIKQSEERHRALVENIGDAIMLVNEKFENIYQTPSAERISGYTLEDGQGKKVFDFVHPNDMEISSNIFQKAFNEPGVPVQGNFRIQHKRGHILWVEGTVTNLFHNESVKAIIVNYRDITERKKATELFKYQFENSPDIILIIDKDFKIESINRARVNGPSIAELIGKNSIDVLPEESRDMATKAVLKCFETGQNQEIENALRDNKWVRSRFVPMIIDGEITRIMIIATDITERKLAEEAIKQSEANYRQLFDSSPAPMWVIDEKTSVIIQVNQACIKNYGYSEEEFKGMTIAAISPGEPKAASQRNSNNTLFLDSQRHIKKSGDLIDVITSSIPVKLNGEKNILMTAIDVTEKNLYEQKLTKAAIKAQEEERYEIGGELHDNVCQLLATSLMFLGIIKKRLPEGSIEIFNETSGYINMATDEIRNLSHRLAPVFFDEETLEDALSKLLRTFNAENKYKMTLSIDNMTKRYPLSRDMQLNLYRIIQEQLRNIMKHAKATEVNVSIIMKDFSFLQMRIVDNGIGFDAKAAKGGIGLANMNRRAQLFSGTFSISSAPGKGCDVLVEIPLSDKAVIT